MLLLGSAFAVFFIIIDKIINKRNITPLQIFSCMWLVILILSGIGLYNLEQASDTAYALIAIGIFSYGMGELLSNKIYFKKYVSGAFYELRTTLIYVLVALTILLYFSDFLKVINYILSGNSLAYIRSISQNQNSVLYEGRGVFESALRMFIVQPFVLAYQVIAAKEFWAGHKKWILFDIIIIILKVLSEGSRSLFLYLGLHLIVIFLLDKNKINKLIGFYNGKKSKKHRKLTLGILILIVASVLIYTTISRSGDRALRTTYYFMCLSV